MRELLIDNATKTERMVKTELVLVMFIARVVQVIREERLRTGVRNL